MKRTVAVLLAAAWATSAASAAAADPVALEGDFVLWAPVEPRYEYAELDLPPAEKAAQRERDTPVAEPLESVHIHVDAEGTVRRSGTRARYYLNRTGVRERGNQSVWVDSFSEVLTIEEAYTLLPDGRRLPVDHGAIQVLPADRDDIFSDYYEVVIPFVGLEPDAIAVVTATVERRPGVWPLPWSRVYYPQLFVPRQSFEFSIAWDAGAEPPVWHSDYEALVCDTTKARRVDCRATGIPAYPEDPQIRYRDVLPQVLVAQRTSWTAFSDAVRSFVESALDDHPSLDREVERLLAGIETEEDRLDRLHRFVSEEIRYVGLEHGLGGIVPRPAALTLERRFGDCKDKTALFIALARRAGLDAFPVLTTFDRSDPRKLALPGATYFDHMVACVPMSWGHEYCVDLTDPHSSYHTLSSSLAGAVRLDLTGGPANLGQFDFPHFGWVVDLETEIRILGNGDLEERYSRTYGGTYAGSLRAYLRSRDHGERQDWLRDQYRDVVSDAAEPEFDIAGLEEQSRRLTLDSEAHYPEIYNPDGPDAFTERQDWLTYEVRAARSENRHHGYRFPGLQYRERTVIDPLPGRTLTFAGATIDFRSTWGEFRRRSRIINGQLVVNTLVSIPSRYVPRDRIADFNRFLSHIVDNAEITYIAERR